MFYTEGVYYKATYRDECERCATCGKRGGEHYTAKHPHTGQFVSFCDSRGKREETGFRAFAPAGDALYDEGL